MVVNWREKKECGYDAKEGTDKDSVYSSVPLKSVGLNLLLKKFITERFEKIDLPNVPWIVVDWLRNFLQSRKFSKHATDQSAMCCDLMRWIRQSNSLLYPTGCTEMFS